MSAPWLLLLLGLVGHGMAGPVPMADTVTGPKTCPGMSLAAPELSQNVPGSKAMIHASCELTVEFTNSCGEVRSEIEARVNGLRTGGISWPLIDP